MKQLNIKLDAAIFDQIKLAFAISSKKTMQDFCAGILEAATRPIAPKPVGFIAPASLQSDAALDKLPWEE